MSPKVLACRVAVGVGAVIVAGLLAYRAAEDVSAKVRMVHVWNVKPMPDELRMMSVVTVKAVNGLRGKRETCRRNDSWKKRMV